MAVSQSLTLTQSSQNVASNYSKVRILWKSTQSGESHNNNTRTAKYYVSINGGAETEYSVSYTLPKASTKTILDTTITVNHKADGTGTIKVRTWMDTKISAGVMTQSKTLTLDTIPRATTPTLSASSVDMGGKVTINTPRASSSFTHDLAYSFAGGSYVSIATGVGTSYSWTTPDLASKIPNAASGTVTICCITKSGSTTVGTKTVTMTLKVPTSVVPTISGVSVAEATSGLAAQFGVYIKGKSKINATVTAAGAKGSTIKSYSTTFNGKTYTGSSWTSAAVTAIGNLNLVTTVTDSRGRTAKKTTTITVRDYAAPAINALHVFRVDGSGSADQDGDHIAVQYKYGVTLLDNKNTADFIVEYKQSTATEWATLLTGSDLSADTTAVPGSPTFSTDYQYDIRATLTDWFGARASYTTQLQSGAVILDIRADGKGIAFGKTSEHGGVEMGWELKTAHGEIPKDAQIIPASAKLDDYKTPGFYAFSSAAAATIAGLPFTGGSGSVQIIPEGDYNQVRQVVTRCSDASREIWERLYYSNTWHDWRPVFKGGTGRVLWSGGMYMTAGHTAPLDEPVSKQPTGIVLVFSEYVDGAASDQSFHHRPILKEVVAAHPGKAECVQLSTSNLAFFATKYLYIFDDKINGHDNNNKTGTGACGITYTNNRFVLRYVIGF